MKPTKTNGCKITDLVIHFIHQRNLSVQFLMITAIQLTVHNLFESYHIKKYSTTSNLIHVRCHVFQSFQPFTNNIQTFILQNFIAKDRLHHMRNRGPVWESFSETRLKAEQAYLISRDLKNLLSEISKVFGCPDYC